MNIGAVIPAEILSRTDLPIYVKLVYGRMTVLLERHGSLVLTTEELANQCGITPRQAAAVFTVANRYLKGEYLKSATSSPEVECLAFRNPERRGLLLVNKSDREVTVTLDLLNLPPAPETVLPAVESVGISGGSVSSEKLPAIPEEVVLKPYGVRLLAR